MVEESAQERELRLARERYQRIKAEVDAPRSGIGGVKIFSASGLSHNKFATLPYSTLAEIQKKENQFRKVLGLKKDKRPINNTENGFKPQVDPRVLRASLKQKRNYHGGGSLNMRVVKSTSALKKEITQKIEMEGRDVDPAQDFKHLDTESVMKMRELAKI